MGFLDRIFGKSKMENPEDEFKITITDELVRVEHPKRKTEMVFWKNIREIRLINTDSGPVTPDIWLALIGNEGGCLLPHGAIGYDQVYEIVSKYKGFDFDSVILSMACTENKEFPLWKKKY